MRSILTASVLVAGCVAMPPPKSMEQHAAETTSAALCFIVVQLPNIAPAPYAWKEIDRRSLVCTDALVAQGHAEYLATMQRNQQQAIQRQANDAAMLDAASRLLAPRPAASIPMPPAPVQCTSYTSYGRTYTNCQ